ncbi:MAG: TlyA family RNA methyltransferase [Phascolarctobacterium sp.]|nr:TlyA family RNA methyltransferase [Phascolarctobacterium sp.]
MTKQRLDVLLVERGLYESRTKAQSAVMAGEILVNDQKIDKPGTQVEDTVNIRILGNKIAYVSRGGLKLEKALRVFPVNLEGKVLADIGASTGGFTDCALQNGADKVFAIDVGYGQLAWKLRSDVRVVNMERTNARYMDSEKIGKVDGVLIDVSFISLDKVLPTAKKLLKPRGFVIALIKPQFEAGRDNVGKKGVVHHSAVHKSVIKNIIAFAGNEDFGIKGLDFSPVKGPEGNIEYLLYLVLGSESNFIDIDNIVQRSHVELKKRISEE